MKKQFKRVLYGGDYNPNQWPKETWGEDMILFKDARINSATINVFSWAKLQPSEDEYNFAQLDEIVDMLCDENYDIVFGTSTAALPAWMFKKYPEVARTDYEGRHHKFGQRHNACPNSLVYQKYAKALVEQLAKRYGDRSQIACWHVNNEYGGECYCENCEKAFRVWLRKKYRTIEALNKAWNLEFWGHTVYDWDEIVLPNALGDGLWNDKTAFAGMSIDYRRFNSDGLLNNFIMERDTIRQYDKQTPITTNLMGTYKGLDYFKWAKEMDIVSWDNYPGHDTPWSSIALCHDLMRGLKDAPFMLMEQTPSQQNWQNYNYLKKPGQMRAQSYQTMAHGADTIQFFQLRRSVGACEKFHGAVIGHAGSSQTRVFQEVKQLGEELESLQDYTLGSKNKAEVAIVFDWDNYWALEYTSGPSIDLTYVKHIHQYYKFFYERNIAVNLVPYDTDFGQYKMVIAPVLYMIKEGMKKALDTFVKDGGLLLTTYMSGIVDQSDNVYLGGYPGPLRDLTGIWVEEIDALSPDQSNEVIFEDGTKIRCGTVCDLMHLEGAECLAKYEKDFYAQRPAVTKHKVDSGATYYIGTNMEDEGIAKVLDMMLAEAKVEAVIPEASDLEVTCRSTEDCKYYFIINFKDEELKIPSYFVGNKDMLTGHLVAEGDMMNRYDVKIIQVSY